MIAQRIPVLASAALAVLALALVAVGCGGGGDSASGSLGSGVVASVAGEEITQTQLDEVIAQAETRLKAQGQKIPAAGSQEYQAFQQNALQFLVQRSPVPAEGGGTGRLGLGRRGRRAGQAGADAVLRR